MGAGGTALAGPPKGRKLAAVDRLGIALADARACLSFLLNNNSLPYRECIIHSIQRDMDVAASLLDVQVHLISFFPTAARREVMGDDRMEATGSHATGVSGVGEAKGDSPAADTHTHTPTPHPTRTPPMRSCLLCKPRNFHRRRCLLRPRTCSTRLQSCAQLRPY